MTTTLTTALIQQYRQGRQSDIHTDTGNAIDNDNDSDDSTDTTIVTTATTATFTSTMATTETNDDHLP